MNVGSIVLPQLGSGLPILNLAFLGLAIVFLWQLKKVRDKEKEKLTKQIRARENELSESFSRAEIADKAREAIIANMNHEFRTPLNSVIGFAELLSEGESDPERADMANCIREAGWRLLELVNGLVQAAEAGVSGRVVSLTTFTLEELAGTVDAMHRETAERKGLGFQTEWEGNRALRGDMESLQKVLGILVGNAVKYSARGTVALSTRELAVVDAQNALVECRVSDHGEGIDPQTLKRLFQPFELGEPTLTKSHEGMGVGLYTAKRLADALHAEIRLESNQRMGTTAYLVVPLEIMDKQERGDEES